MSQYWTVSRLRYNFMGGVFIGWGCFWLWSDMSCAIAVCEQVGRRGGRWSENGGNLGKIRVRIPRRESNYPRKGAEILGFLLLALDRFPNYSPIHNGPWPPTMQP